MFTIDQAVYGPEAARFIGVNVATLRKWAEAGMLRAFRVAPTCTLYARPELEAIKARRDAAQQEQRA